MVSFLGLQFVILAMGTMVTYSRNAWLCTTIGLIAITFVNQPWRRSVLTAVAIAAVITLMVALVPPVRYQFVESFQPGSSQLNSIIERLAFAAEAARIWWQHPIVGIGFGRFEDVANLARLSAGAHVSSSYVPGSTHDEYLTTLLKGGLLSGLSFLAFVVVSWRTFSRYAHTRTGTDTWRWGSAGIGILTTLLAGAVGGDSFRLISVSGPFFILVGGLSALSSPQELDGGAPHGE
jgi:O-antigen ligase